MLESGRVLLYESGRFCTYSGKSVNVRSLSRLNTRSVFALFKICAINLPAVFVFSVAVIGILPPDVIVLLPVGVTFSRVPPATDWSEHFSSTYFHAAEPSLSTSISKLKFRLMSMLSKIVSATELPDIMEFAKDSAVVSDMPPWLVNAFCKTEIVGIWSFTLPMEMDGLKIGTSKFLENGSVIDWFSKIEERALRSSSAFPSTENGSEVLFAAPEPDTMFLARLIIVV